MTSRCVGLSAVVISFAFAFAPARRASAEDSPACPAAETGEKGARKSFDEGTQRETADPEGALASYRCAAKLAEKPAIFLRIGVVAERLERYDEAIDAFERYLRLAGSDAPDAVEMKEHVKKLRARREEIARRATAAAAPPPESRGLPPPAPPREPPSKIAPVVGWTLIGAGVLAAAGGSLLLLDAKGKSDDVQALPTGTRWASDQAQDTFDAAKTEQTFGIVCLIAAPLFVAGGILLHATRASNARTTAIVPSAHGLAVRF